MSGAQAKNPDTLCEPGFWDLNHIVIQAVSLNGTARLEAVG